MSRSPDSDAVQASGRVVTFYSFKGGVGRTLALADVAAQLALWGYRVLAVDMDLEAPGLDEFFAKQSKSRQRSHTGLIDVFSKFQPKRKLAWRSAVRTVRVRARNATGTVALLSAGPRNEGYAKRVQALSWDALYKRGIGRAIEAMREQWVREYDLVLVDSRTGVSDTGGICTIQLPDSLVILFTPNEQSVEGVRVIARAAQSKQAELPLDRGRLLVVPVACRIDQTEHRLREEWQRRIVQRLGGFVEQWAGSKSLAAEIIGHLSVPYVPFWSYGEALPVLDDSPSEKLGVRFAHETLAALLASDLAGAIDLAKNRDAFVREAQTPRAPGRKRIDVFLGHTRTHRKLSLGLAAELRKHGLEVWLDDAKMRAGEDWATKLATAVSEARTIVVVAEKQLTDWQTYELKEIFQALLRDEKVVIPLVPADVHEMGLPIPLRQFKWIPIKKGESMELIANRIAAATRAVMSRDEPRPRARPRGRTTRRTAHRSVKPSTRRKKLRR